MKKLEKQATIDLVKLCEQNTPLTDEQLDKTKLNNQSIIDLIDAKNENGASLLHIAISLTKKIRLNEFSQIEARRFFNNLKVLIQYLLKHNIDLNATIEGVTALMLSVSRINLEILGDDKRDDEIIKLLLSHNPDTSIVDANGYTLLHYASQRPEIVFNQILEVCSKQINEKNKEGKTPLFYAVRMSYGTYEHLKIVEKLIQAGADVNTLDSGGESILSYYLKNIEYHSQFSNHVTDLINILIDAGINLNHIDPDGSTIADLAAKARIPMTVFKKHLSRGDKLPDDANLLHYAAANGDIAFIKYLAETSEINAKLSDGRTPLMIAINIWGLNSDLVKTLMMCGAEIPENLSDQDKATLKALDKKIIDIKKHNQFGELRVTYQFRNSIDTPEKLTLKGYPIIDLLDAQDVDGNTLLHLSLTSDRYGKSLIFFKYLLSNGANLTQKNKKGITPLDMLTELFSNKKIKIEKDLLELLLKKIDRNTLETLPQEIKNILFISAVKLEFSQNDLENLLSAGAEINSFYKGNTALHYANSNNNVDVVNWLLAKDADPNLKDSDGHSLLHSALISYSLRNHKRITPSPEQEQKQKEYLISLITNPKINKNTADSRGFTLLFHVDDCKIFEELVKNGANHDAQDNDGNTVLHHAAKDGNLELCTYIIENHPDLLKVVNKFGRTALFNVDTPEIISLICKRLPELINLKDNEGLTPLNEIMFLQSPFNDLTDNRYKTIKAFIENGADISFNYNKESFVFYLARKTDQNIVEHLLKNGIDPTSTSNNGSSFAEIALSNSKISPEIFSTFIKGDTKLPNSANLLHYAVHNNMLDLIWPLIAVQRFDINQSLEGEGGHTTPLLIAIQRHGPESPMVKQLIDRGAKIPDSLTAQETLAFAISNFKNLLEYKQKNNDEINWNQFINKPEDKNTDPIALFFDFLSSGKKEFIKILGYATNLGNEIAGGERSQFATLLAHRLCNDTPWPAYQKSKFTTKDLAGIAKLELHTGDFKLSLKDKPDLQNALFALIAYAGKLNSGNEQDEKTQHKIDAITNLVNNILAKNDPDQINTLLEEALKNDDLTQNRTTGFYRLYSIFKSEHKWNKPAKHVVRSTTEELLLNLKQVFDATKASELEEGDEISSEHSDDGSKSSKSN